MSVLREKRKRAKARLLHRQMFLDEVIADITAAINDAVSAYGSDVGDASMSRTANNMVVRLPLVFSGLPRTASSNEWGRAHRLLSAVCRGLESGLIELRDQEDISLLFFLLDTSFYRQVRAIEHYVNTGEIMAVMSIVRQDFYIRDARRDIPTQGFQMVHPNTFHQQAHLQLMKLYEFDMNKATDRVYTGDDERLWTQLPLEMRANLAGFYDDEKREQ